MQTLTLNIKNKDATNKMMWLLKHFEHNEIEIVEQEYINDLKILAATRDEKSIPFNEYLSNES